MFLFCFLVGRGRGGWGSVFSLGVDGCTWVNDNSNSYFCNFELFNLVGKYFYKSNTVQCLLVNVLHIV